MKNDQFAVYRVDRNSEGRDLWHLSYQEAVSRKLAIRIEHYRQIISDHYCRGRVQLLYGNA